MGGKSTIRHAHTNRKPGVERNKKKAWRVYSRCKSSVNLKMLCNYALLRSQSEKNLPPTDLSFDHDRDKENERGTGIPVKPKSPLQTKHWLGKHLLVSIILWPQACAVNLKSFMFPKTAMWALVFFSSPQAEKRILIEFFLPYLCCYC